MDQRAAQFDEYLRLYTRGLKAEAKAALQEFIEGFSGLAEKIAWTDRNFDTLVHNRHARIRHELYESVVFPALLHGFEADDPQAKFRLAASEQNLLSAQHLHAKIGYRSGLDLLTEAYTADPENEQYQDALLQSLLADFWISRPRMACRNPSR